MRVFNVPDALESLGIKEWVLSSIPTNEQEFLTYFSKGIGLDQNNHTILSNDPQSFGVTWDQIQAEIQKLQTDYNSKNYQRNRAAEYPSFADQFDTIFHEGIDAWKAQIQEIKDKYPKA